MLTILSLNGHLSLESIKYTREAIMIFLNSEFWGWLSMESQPQNSEFRNIPENFHPCDFAQKIGFGREISETCHNFTFLLKAYLELCLIDMF